MGDLVAYVNPEALWLDESDGQLLTVEEIVSFGADAPPLAILTTHDGEMWEVTANNLAPIQPVDGDTLTRHPDLRLRLILTIARTLAGRGDVPWVGHPGGDALAAHILTLDGGPAERLRAAHPVGLGTAPPATTGPPRRSRSRGRRCDRDPGSSASSATSPNTAITTTGAASPARSPGGCSAGGAYAIPSPDPNNHGQGQIVRDDRHGTHVLADYIDLGRPAVTGPERTPLDAAQLACLTHIPRGNQRRPRYHPPAEVEPGVVLVELSPDPRDQWGRTSFAAYWHGRRPCPARTCPT